MCKPDSIDTILEDLPNRVSFGPLRVYIQASGIGGRYQALIHCPKGNVFVETPQTVNTEGILSFCQRLAPEIARLWQEALKDST